MLMETNVSSSKTQHKVSNAYDNWMWQLGFIYQDGKVIIANYVNGLSDGFRREWSGDGTLEYAGFFQVSILLLTETVPKS